MTSPLQASRRLHVAFFLPTLDVGGAERIAVRTAARLDRTRFRPSLVAFRRGSGLAAAPLAGTDVPVDVLGETPRDVVLAPFRLWRYLRRRRPDILLTYMFHANIAGRLVGRVAGVSAIVSSERVVGWESRWRVFIDRRTLLLADLVTTNSEEGRRFWADRLRCAPERIEVIYNGVDTSEFAPAHRPAPLIVKLGVLARLHRANGHDWLVDALLALRRRLPDGWICLLGGAGPEGAALQAKVRRLGLNEMVQFVGHVSDAPAFLRSIDICVHPSLVAGMPNAVLESMACGLPVIATRVGGTPEAVAEGVTGCLVDVGDSEGLAARAEALVGDAVRRRKMGEAGRDRILGLFSLDAMMKRTEDVLERVSLRRTMSGQSEVGR